MAKNIIMFHIDHQIVIQQWYGHLTQGDHKVSTFMRTRDMIFVYANFLIILEKNHIKLLYENYTKKTKTDLQSFTFYRYINQKNVGNRN